MPWNTSLFSQTTLPLAKSHRESSTFCFFSEPTSSAGRFLPICVSAPSPAPAGAAFGFFLTTIPFIRDLTSFRAGLGGTFLVVADCEDEDVAAKGAGAACRAANALIIRRVRCRNTRQNSRTHSRYSANSLFSASLILSSSFRFSSAFSARNLSSSAPRPRHWLPSFILLSHSSVLRFCSLAPLLNTIPSAIGCLFAAQSEARRRTFCISRR